MFLIFLALLAGSVTSAYLGWMMNAIAIDEQLSFGYWGYIFYGLAAIFALAAIIEFILRVVLLSQGKKTKKRKRRKSSRYGNWV